MIIDIIMFFGLLFLLLLTVILYKFRKERSEIRRLLPFLNVENLDTFVNVKHGDHICKLEWFKDNRKYNMVIFRNRVKINEGYKNYSDCIKNTYSFEIQEDMCDSIKELIFSYTKMQELMRNNVPFEDVEIKYLRYSQDFSKDSILLRDILNKLKK